MMKYMITLISVHDTQACELVDKLYNRLMTQLRRQSQSRLSSDLCNQLYFRIRDQIVDQLNSHQIVDQLNSQIDE